MSPHQVLNHQDPQSTSSSFQESPTSSLRPQSASPRISLRQEPPSSGYYDDKRNLRGRLSSPKMNSYQQETPRSSSDFQEDTPVSPRLSFNQEPARSAPSPVFHELPRSSSPNPPREYSSRSSESQR